MTRRLAIALLAILVASLVALLLLNRPRPTEPATPAPGKRVERPVPPVAPAPVEPPREPLVLYFEDEEDLLLHRERQDLPVADGAVGRIHAAVDGLLRGSGSPGRIRNIPEGTAVRAIYLAPPGLVTVDLEIVPGGIASLGSHQEWVGLQSLVATVLDAAPPDTAGILVTVAGETPETLAGHVDLSRPIRLDPRLVSPDPAIDVAPVPPAPPAPAATSAPRPVTARPASTATPKPPPPSEPRRPPLPPDSGRPATPTEDPEAGESAAPAPPTEAVP